MNVLVGMAGTQRKPVWAAVRADPVPTNLMMVMFLALCVLPDLTLQTVCPMRRAWKSAYVEMELCPSAVPIQALLASALEATLDPPSTAVVTCAR